MRLLRHLPHGSAGADPASQVPTSSPTPLPSGGGPLRFPGPSGSQPLRQAWPAASPHAPSGAAALSRRASCSRWRCSTTQGVPRMKPAAPACVRTWQSGRPVASPQGRAPAPKRPGLGPTPWPSCAAVSTRP
jgi:hypothetical protein